MRSLFRAFQEGNSLLILIVGLLAAVFSPNILAADVVLEIEKTHNTPLGGHVNVAITSIDVAEGFQLGGFDFLIEYDDNLLTLESVSPGQALTDCDWEYFTYSIGSSSACPDTADLGTVVAIIAVANMNDGQNYPDCYLETPGELAVMDFLVTDQDTAECHFAPVRWLWCDCSHNVISSLTGDTIFVSDSVYFVDYGPWGNFTVDEPFPTHGGANSDCLTGDNVIRAVDLIGGGVDIDCTETIARGDINLNGVDYEIADYVLFANWFYYGGSVFIVSHDAQVIATDVNANGSRPELADFVYLGRVIVGDAQPFPVPPAAPVGDTMVITQDMVTKVITIDYPDSINGMFMVFVGDIHPWDWEDHPDQPFNGLFTKVLLESFLSGGDTLFYQDPFMTYTGEGTLVSAIASYDGLSHIPIKIQFADIPGCCEIRGNVDRDPNGTINILDLIYLVKYMFHDGVAPPCPTQVDINGDDQLTIDDLIHLVAYMFSSGPPPQSCD